MDDEERDERMEWPAEKDQCECECQCVFPPVTVDLDLSDVTFFHKLCSIDPDTQTPSQISRSNSTLLRSLLSLALASLRCLHTTRPSLYTTTNQHTSQTP